MTIQKFIAIGIGGNEVSKQITGTSEVSAGRSAVATVAGGVLSVGATAAGMAAAPVVVPLVVVSAAVSFIASLFD